MIKKIFIILSFFSFFWFKPPIILAIEPEPDTTQEEEGVGFIQQILIAIGDFFKFLKKIFWIFPNSKWSGESPKNLLLLLI